MTSHHHHDHDHPHPHTFHAGSEKAEQSTRWVMWITLATMVVEIAAGLWFNSMALLADGWHMSSHALAIGLAAFAYATSRRLANDRSFAFGTYKIEVLAAFASAVFLIGVAVLMVVGSVERLIEPQSIHYAEAVAVAVVGLLINVVCALILNHQGHEHHHHHEHGHKHHDLNLKAAYIHVLTDALTSVLAIVALLGAWFYGLNWLDPVMGVVGAVLVALWAKGLLAQSARVLLDREMNDPVVEQLRDVLAALPGIAVKDLRVWRVGSAKFAATTWLESESLQVADVHRAIEQSHLPLTHVTVQVSRP